MEGKVKEDDYAGLEMEGSNVLTMEEARQRFSRGVTIDLGSVVEGDLVARLRSSLEPHRRADLGCPVAIVCRKSRDDGLAAQGRILLGENWRVTPSDELLKRLRREFGAERVSLVYPEAKSG